jgi:hypothetical protein
VAPVRAPIDEVRAAEHVGPTTLDGQPPENWGKLTRC